MFSINASIILFVLLKTTSSISISSFENLDNTKLIVFIVGFPRPILSLGKSSVDNDEIIDFKPLCPPAEPLSLYLILENSKLKSSEITNISFR